VSKLVDWLPLPVSHSTQPPSVAPERMLWTLAVTFQLTVGELTVTVFVPDGFRSAAVAVTQVSVLSFQADSAGAAPTLRPLAEVAVRVSVALVTVALVGTFPPP
jgi:hypothetical protein